MSRKIENRIQKRRSVTLIGEGITEQYYFTHIRTLFGYRFTIKPYYFSVTSLVEMDKKIAEAIQDGGFAILYSTRMLPVGTKLKKGNWSLSARNTLTKRMSCFATVLHP